MALLLHRQARFYGTRTFKKRTKREEDLVCWTGHKCVFVEASVRPSGLRVSQQGILKACLLGYG